jgi:hypothetical protein
MVVAAGDVAVVEDGGPGVVVAGVAGEVAQCLAELLVASPPEGDGFDLAGLLGRGGDTGQRGQRVSGGELAAGVADLGEEPGGAQRLDPGQGRVDVGVGVGGQLLGEVVLECGDLGVQDAQGRPLQDLVVRVDDADRVVVLGPVDSGTDSRRHSLRDAGRGETHRCLLAVGAVREHPLVPGHRSRLLTVRRSPAQSPVAGLGTRGASAVHLEPLT